MQQQVVQKSSENSQVYQQQQQQQEKVFSTLLVLPFYLVHVPTSHNSFRLKLYPFFAQFACHLVYFLGLLVLIVHVDDFAYPQFHAIFVDVLEAADASAGGDLFKGGVEEALEADSALGGGLLEGEELLGFLLFGGLGIVGGIMAFHGGNLILDKCDNWIKGYFRNLFYRNIIRIVSFLKIWNRLTTTSPPNSPSSKSKISSFLTESPLFSAGTPSSAPWITTPTSTIPTTSSSGSPPPSLPPTSSPESSTTGWAEFAPISFSSPSASSSLTFLSSSCSFSPSSSKTTSVLGFGWV